MGHVNNLISHLPKLHNIIVQAVSGHGSQGLVSGVRSTALGMGLLELDYQHVWNASSTSMLDAWPLGHGQY